MAAHTSAATAARWARSPRAGPSALGSEVDSPRPSEWSLPTSLGDPHQRCHPIVGVAPGGWLGEHHQRTVAQPRTRLRHTNGGAHRLHRGAARPAPVGAYRGGALNRTLTSGGRTAVGSSNHAQPEGAIPGMLATHRERRRSACGARTACLGALPTARWTTAKGCARPVPLLEDGPIRRAERCISQGRVATSQEPPVLCFQPRLEREHLCAVRGVPGQTREA